MTTIGHIYCIVYLWWHWIVIRILILSLTVLERQIDHNLHGLSPGLPRLPLMLKVCLCLFLMLPYFFECHPIPVVHPAEHLSVEGGEESMLCVHQNVLAHVLESPPLEFDGDQLVSRHDGIWG